MKNESLVKCMSLTDQSCILWLPAAAGLFQQEKEPSVNVAGHNNKGNPLLVLQNSSALMSCTVYWSMQFPN